MALLQCIAPLLARLRHPMMSALRTALAGKSGLDDRFQESGCVCQVRTDGTGRIVVDSSFVIDVTRSGIMAGWRQAVELAMTSEEIAQLTSVSHSRTERASRV